jgi:NADH-quinone oxidoreductase E subunit
VSPAPVTTVASFRFTPENDALAKAIIARYPPGRQASAVLALLTLAQEQCGGWLPQPALDYVADHLAMPPIRVYEVASFYDMFNTKPVGRTQIRVCTTTPCQLCGSDGVLAACEESLGIQVGQSTADGRFFLREFECLGACANAPVLWIDDDFYEDLTYDSTRAIIAALQRGEHPTPGSQAGRQASMPAGGKTTLLADPHRDRGGGGRGGRGDPGHGGEPVDKGRPDERVKGHAVKVERQGRPAEGAGDEALAEPKDPDAR